MDADDAVQQPPRGGLKVWHKITLACLFFALPVAVALVPMLVRWNADAAAAAKAQAATEYLRPVRALQEHLALHRLLSRRAAAGQPVAVEELAGHATAVDAALRDLAAVDAKSGAAFGQDGRTTAALVADIKQHWQDVSRQAAGVTPEQSEEQHRALQTSVRDLARLVGESSGLAQDAQADGAALAGVVLFALPDAERRLDEVLDLGEQIAARKQATPEERAELAGRLARLRASLDELNGPTGLPAAFRSDSTPDRSLKAGLDRELEAATATFGAVEDTVRTRLLGAAQPAVKSDALQLEGVRAVQAGWALWDGSARALDAAEQRRAAGARHAQGLVILGVGGAAFGAALVLFLVLRGVNRQVRSLAGSFERLREGDYGARAHVYSRDELGGLAVSLNTTLDDTLALVQSREERDQIQASIGKLLEEVSGVGEGDLTKQAEVTADVTGAIADSFNYMIDQLRKIIGTVQNTTVQVSSSASDIQSSAEHLAEGAQAQAEQIVRTSAAIEDMAESIQKVSANAAVSADVAQTALARARNGNAAVQNTVAGMTRIRDQVQETAKRLKRLGESSQEIGQIVQMIDDIADRTSILALNASIQAAAAGEAGRGFAVVAEEVERLAVRSTEATKKIAGLVKTIQGETTEAVAAMEKGIQEVVEGSKLANQAGQSLGEIEAVSQRLAELIQSISRSAEQQAKGSEALAKSMAEISAITKQTADGTMSAAAAVNALAALADELRESVSAFRLPGHESGGDGAALLEPRRATANGKNGSRSRSGVRLR